MSWLLVLALLPLDVTAPKVRPNTGGAFPFTIEVRLVQAQTRETPATFEVRHTWRGPVSMRFLARWEGQCGGPQDYLLVDGVPRTFGGWLPCAAAPLPVGETLAPGESFSNRGVLRLARGRHVIQADYTVSTMQAATVSRSDNLNDWSGAAKSPAITIEVE